MNRIGARGFTVMPLYVRVAPNGSTPVRNKPLSITMKLGNPVKTPRQVIEEWVAAFNARDAAQAAALYHDDATNWQVAAGPPLLGRSKIYEDLTSFFVAFPDSVTHVENLFESGEWVILEWSGGATWKGAFAGMPPNGKQFALRGCGCFHVVQGKIKFQRGYWDRATWFKQLGIPV